MADKNKRPDAAPAAAPAGEEGEKKRGNLPLVIGIIVGVVILQTALVYLIVPKPVNEEAKAAKAAADSAETATRMGAVSEAPLKATVNIAGTDVERYAKVAVILEYDEKNIQLGIELQKRAPKHNDLLIKHMSTLTLMELTETGAQEKIGNDLQRIINNTLPMKLGEVQNVLFTEFIIQ